ncbi:MAG: efflux RND transporter permease subunit, partial [Pseudobdellovibrionaceae bacterium]
AEVKALVQEWQNQNPQYKGTSIQFEDGEFEVNDSLKQLSIAFSLSLLLIFLTMVLQMGHVVNSLLVLAAIPLGFIGVIVSLFVFQSTVSLNSMLGIILLNGIAVANSIILVDFIQRQVDSGMTPLEAALVSGKTRLRPILMTTMTTLLGMTPIALGLGEGGKILQPLGISVIGGLGVSTLLTLFIVPALQTSYLQFKAKKSVQ